MLVVPVSFGFMAFWVIVFFVLFGLVRLMGSLTTTSYKPVRLGRRQPAPLTWGHRAFATAVPLGLIALIAALGYFHAA